MTKATQYGVTFGKEKATPFLFTLSMIHTHFVLCLPVVCKRVLCYMGIFIKIFETLIYIYELESGQLSQYSDVY
jgi:hypothetical protein